MGPCGKAAAGHEESNHTSGCSYFAILISESGWARSAGFSWINLKLRKSLENAVCVTCFIVGPSGGAGEKLFVFVCVCCLGKRAHKDSDEQ